MAEEPKWPERVQLPHWLMASIALGLAGYGTSGTLSQPYHLKPAHGAIPSVHHRQLSSLPGLALSTQVSRRRGTGLEGYFRGRAATSPPPA